jgi:hypothetical protein
MESIIYQGRIYDNLADLASNLGIDIAILRSRINAEWPEADWARAVQPGVSLGNKGVVYKGEVYPSVMKLAEELGIKYATLHSRIKQGWPEARWGERPRTAKPVGPSRKVVYQKKEFESVVALASFLGVNSSTLNKRINAGLPEEEWGIRRSTGRPGRSIEHAGMEFSSHRQLASHIGISSAGFSSRISNGLEGDDLYSRSKHRGRVKLGNQEYSSIHSLAAVLAKDNGQTQRAIARKICAALDAGQSLEQSVEFALADPTKTSIEYNGTVYASISELSACIGVNYQTLFDRIRKGWPEELWEAESLPTAAPDLYYCIDNPQMLVRSCSVYIVNMKRFPEYQKIGVAVSPGHRYDREYGEENYLREFGDRLRALIFEGVLLALTEAESECPEQLNAGRSGNRWHGSTEVRKICWEELRNRVEYAESELHEYGFEELAIRYIPMSRTSKAKLSEALLFLDQDVSKRVLPSH